MIRESRFKYNKDGVDQVINELISVDDSLKHYYLEQFKADYLDGDSTRIFYMDIAHISRYVVECTKTGKTDFFDKLFDKVEYVISDCDTDVENLIVVGLFEGIQNIGGQEIDYYFGFNKWLRPTSRIKWESLIDAWEGIDWRKGKGG